MRRLIAAVALVAAVAACSSEANDAPAAGSNQALLDAKKVLELKLYEGVPYASDASCDVHTAATVLEAQNGELRLEVENRVLGTCDLPVQADKRSYAVTTSRSCGAILYQGVSGADSVVLQDNRLRLCKDDPRPAMMELRETRNGRERVLLGREPLLVGDGELLDVKLYDLPHQPVIAFCDRYTHLGLKRENGIITARVEDRLSPDSACEHDVPPNRKVFTMTVSESCGSTVYSSPAGSDRIVIQDNATRTCDDEIPARLEVQYTQENRTKQLYSTE